jgi:tetratricopeptide (TPR) repeat protein
VLKQQGKLEEAITLYRGVIRSKPDYADGYSNLGFALAELGELDEARNALESAVKLAPANANAYRLAADLKRFCANDPYLAAMEKLARDMNSLSPEEQIDLHFALAKAYEDLGLSSSYTARAMS